MMPSQNWVDIIEPLLSIDAQNGLPEDVFLTVSTLVPIVNVDLLILDENKRILLIRRNDPFFGEGWHIPGGCVRFRETMAQRVDKTALSELGCAVTFDPTPIAVRDVIIDEQREALVFNNHRAHHLAVLFRCQLPAGYDYDNGGKAEKEPGFIKWFDCLPADLLRVHDVYIDDIKREMLPHENDET